jgi:hypothetical protein
MAELSGSFVEVLPRGRLASLHTCNPASETIRSMNVGAIARLRNIADIPSVREGRWRRLFAFRWAYN